MKRLAALLAYLGCFLAARGLLFASPLLLASVLPAAEYATMEWALATATLASAVLTLGTGSLVPVVLVGSAPAGISLRAIRLHHLAVIALALAVSATWWLGLPMAKVGLLLGALSLVALKSTELKSHGQATASLLLDALLLASMAALAWLGGGPTPIAALSPWLAPLALLLVLAGRALLDLGLREWPVARQEWVAVIQAGLPLMVTGALATLVTTSGRAGVGALLPGDEAAAYSVLSRGAALPIVAHQALVVAAYRRLFVVEPASLVRLLLGIVLGVAASALTLWWLLPALGWLLGPAFTEASGRHPQVLLVLLAQALLWSAIALNDLLNVRHGSSAKVLRWTLPGALLLLALAFAAFLLSSRSLQAFVVIHGAAMMVFYLLQCLAMRANGVQVPLLCASVTAGYLAILGIGLIT